MSHLKSKKLGVWEVNFLVPDSSPFIVSFKEMSSWDSQPSDRSYNCLTKVSKVRMLGSDPNETMSNSSRSTESPQLTKVRELDFDSPSRSRNNRKYKEVREREYLYEHEVEAMLKAAKTVGRHGHRDVTLILLAYRHGLRVTSVS